MTEKPANLETKIKPEYYWPFNWSNVIGMGIGVAVTFGIVVFMDYCDSRNTRIIIGQYQQQYHNCLTVMADQNVPPTEAQELCLDKCWRSNLESADYFNYNKDYQKKIYESAKEVCAGEI